MTQTIDIKAFIDDRPISAFLWALVAMCFLIVVADGMNVAIMGFVTPPILQDWNISRPTFGFVISAAPFGLVIGARIAGPSSYRFGRKIVLTTSVLLFGVFTVIVAWSSSPQEMALLRLLGGMGMGAAMPNATTLLSEYAPLRRRSLMITIMFSGFTLGSAAIGFIAGYMIPHFGWRSVLLVGGVTPLVLVLLVGARLPESARYMALHATPADRIAATLGRVTGYRFTGGETFVSTEPPLPTKRPIGVLFSDGYAATTIAALGHLFHGPDGRLFADGMAADPDEGRGRLDHHRRQRHGDVPDRRHDRRDPDRMEHGPGTSFPGDRRRVSGGRRLHPGACMGRGAVRLARRPRLRRGLLRPRGAHRPPPPRAEALSDHRARHPRQLDARHGPLRQ